MLVSISGIDCSGKTTFAAKLAARISGTVLTFPDRASVSGVEIDKALRMEQRLPPAALAALFAVNRLEHSFALWGAAGHKSEHVVCCRYTPDALAYGTMEGLAPYWLRAIDYGVPASDVAVLLDVSPEVAAARLLDRPTRERYERSIPQLAEAANELRHVWATSAGTSRTLWATSTDLDEVVGLCAGTIARLNKGRHT